MAGIADIASKLRTMVAEEAVITDESYASGVACAAQFPAEKLRDAANFFNSEGYFLETITALDFKDTAELVYHFNSYEPKSRVAIRVRCLLEDEVSSVSDIFLTALWLEREVHEFFGIGFAGHPDLKPLLLPEDIGPDYRPLRKTFGIVHAHRNREEIYG